MRSVRSRPAAGLCKTGPLSVASAHVRWRTTTWGAVLKPTGSLAALNLDSRCAVRSDKSRDLARKRCFFGADFGSYSAAGSATLLHWQSGRADAVLALRTEAFMPMLRGRAGRGGLPVLLRGRQPSPVERSMALPIAQPARLQIRGRRSQHGHSSAQTSAEADTRRHEAPQSRQAPLRAP